MRLGGREGEKELTIRRFTEANVERGCVGRRAAASWPERMAPVENNRNHVCVNQCTLTYAARMGWGKSFSRKQLQQRHNSVCSSRLGAPNITRDLRRAPSGRYATTEGTV